MMRCALPFLCSFRPSRNLGHVEASSTYEAPSTLGVRQGATSALHLGLQIAASCSRSCCWCKLQRTGTRELESRPLRCSGPPASPRSCAHYDFYRFTSADYLSPPAPPQPAPTTHPDRERATTRDRVQTSDDRVRWRLALGRCAYVVCGRHTFLSNSISGHRTQAFNYNLFKLVINRVSPSVLPVLAVLGCAGAHVTHVARPAHQPLRGCVVGAQDAHKAEAAHKDHQP